MSKLSLNDDLCDCQSWSSFLLLTSVLFFRAGYFLACSDEADALVKQQMIEELGIADPGDVGYYAGVVESLFAFTLFCTGTFTP
jgi:hypothetical protein